ncbi:MAG TPA: prepilin peptidase [Stellaceae bacterium]|nr:prepilin peptidase [Stellaceae bacterium]
MLASVALAVYAVALAAAGVGDVVRFQIPNGLSVALVLAFVLFAPALPLAVTAWHLATGLAVLAATAAGFALRLMGGGDAKLIAATALWLGWRNLMPFLVLMVLAGGVLGLVVLVARRFAPDPVAPGRWYSRVLARDEGVPYGLAIALAGLALLPRLSPALLQ